MTREMFDRMDGLVSTEAMTQLLLAVASMTRTLVAEGFEVEDVAAYMQQNATEAVTMIADDMA